MPTYNYRNKTAIMGTHSSWVTVAADDRKTADDAALATGTMAGAPDWLLKALQADDVDAALAEEGVEVIEKT